MKGKYKAKKNKQKLNKKMSVDKAKIEIVNKIIEQIKEILEDPVKDKDSIVGLGDTIKYIVQPILDKFNHLISKNEDKNSFTVSLIKFFIIHLSSKSTTLAKIFKNLQIKHKNCTRFMVYG